jgi:excisionase family DNA binding protein
MSIPRFNPMPRPPIQFENFLTVQEFAAAARLSLPAVYGMVRRGVVKANRIGDAIRIPESEARRHLSVVE